MSHTQVQYLKKQVERKDAQIRVLMDAFESLYSENEFLASVACGFAWDLQAQVNNREHWDIDEITLGEIERKCSDRWDEAVAAVKGQMTATEIALREANKP